MKEKEDRIAELERKIEEFDGYIRKLTIDRLTETDKKN